MSPLQKVRELLEGAGFTRPCIDKALEMMKKDNPVFYMMMSQDIEQVLQMKDMIQVMRQFVSMEEMDAVTNKMINDEAERMGKNN